MKPAAPRSPGRRRLMLAAGTAAGAFVLGGWFFYRERDRMRVPASLAVRKGESAFSAWIKIDTDGLVWAQVPRQEMGQGVTTALPMLVAEELDCDMASVRYEQAPIDGIYANGTMLADAVPFRPDATGWVADLVRLTQYKAGELIGLQATGGSSSVRDAWLVMRHAGAAARAMLVTTAAKRWAVDANTCATSGGSVVHAASGRRMGYGALALEAAQLPVPSQVMLKDPRTFRILGKPQPRLDTAAKVDGSALFACDVRVPGLRFAAIAQCPVFGGTLESATFDEARRNPGVIAVMDLQRTSTTPAAVVVVADGWWKAKTVLAGMTIKWQEGANAQLNSTAQREAYSSLLDRGSARAYETVGEGAEPLKGSQLVVEAVYEVPYLAHATMEPMNATALVRDGRCEVWVGSQAPSLVKWMASSTAGVPRDAVTVHTPLLGGGFGRRAEMDVVVQAVSIAAKLPGVPVQLLWSREEDMQHDVYRPMALSRLRCALAPDGTIAVWHHRIVGQSCTQGITGRLLPLAASDLLKDKTVAEGAYDLPYAMPNRLVEHVLAEQPVPVGYWRSVGHSYNAFFVEAFLDEVAKAAGKDPYEFRRSMLSASPRHRRVLETAAAMAGWGQPLAADSGKKAGRGIALAESFHSIVAQVAEVEVDADNALRVRRVFCAVDCGMAINPSIVIAQMQSGIVFGLSAVLHGEITLKAGRVEQSNFHDYAMVRMAECPAIEVKIVDSGWDQLGGVGEPGTPPIAPAVANAVLAATGRPVRRLPVKL